MGKGTIGNKIVLEGEKSYREALKSIKTEQAELRSEMKLCQSSFKENQNSADALKKKYEILTKQMDTQTNKVELYQKAVTDYSEKQERAADKIEELRAALSKAETDMKQMSESSDKSSEAISEQAKTIEELKKQLADAEKNYTSAGQKVSYYQTNVNNAKAELAAMENELQKTDQYMKEVENATNKCATSIDKYGNETKEAADKTDVFGDVLKANLLSDAIHTGIEKLAEGIKKVAESATDAGSSFESSMSQVAATMGMTADEVENGSDAYVLLADAAKKCGAETMFSASEAGEALNYLALAGYDAEKSAATLPKVLDLAAAGNLDLAYSSDLVTDSMAAMNMETSELDNYIDEMAKTSQKANTSVAQLGEATLVCAGTVSLTGQSLETMNTELGVLANNGIKGAEGGTHLRNILLSLSAPTDKAAETIGELGLRITDSQGNMRDLNDILIDLNVALSSMSSTEKTKTISKIFNKTDIAAVNALLKGTGEEYNKLNTEIKNCSGAASEMAKTLNNNLKGKVDELESGLEGLGITAYEIFDDDMKKAVVSATEAVGRLQKSMSSGDLGVSMRKFSQSLGDLVEDGVEFGEDALPVVIDGLTWLMDNSEIVISGIVGLTAATKGAVIAQEIMNMVMSLNPAALLMKSIVGLTAAMATFVIMADSNTVVLDETTQKTKELVQQSKELNDTYTASSAERAASRKEMETEAGVCKKLVQELSSLQSKTTLTMQEQARQKTIVEQLNQIMPELNLAIDEQTNKLNMSTQELEKNVDALMAQAKAEAAREDLLRIAEEQYEAEKKLAELEEQRSEQIDQIKEAQSEYNDLIIHSNDDALSYASTLDAMGGTQSTLAENVEQARAAQEELDAQIAATQETIAGYTEEYEETMNYIADTEPIASASEAMSGLGDSATATGDSISGLSETAQQAFSDMYTSVSESIENQMNLFLQWDTEMVASGEQMVANMQSQVNGLQEWADNIQELADRGINQGLLQKLADMGPAGAGYVAAFVDMTDEELQKANELYAESFTVSDDVATQIAESYAGVGDSAIKGMTDKISESSETVKQSGIDTGENLQSGVEEKLEIEGESKVFANIGISSIQGLITGVKGEEANATNTVQNLAGGLVTKTQSELKTSTFAEIGKQIPAGLVQGINSGQSAVVNAIVEMCTKAVEASKTSLDIHSPSRKSWWMGEMYDRGLADGVIENTELVTVAMNSMCTKAIDSTNAALSSRNIEAELSAITHTQAVISAATNDRMQHSGQSIIQNSGNKTYNIDQTFQIYGDTPDLIETSKQYRDIMREVAKEW
ncbi:MAG: phage tail tape measure protein [Lachnospiraceae bacterium]|nr:phage tail tape measure protein [Lachnospiraceae bacterium]